MEKNGKTSPLTRILIVEDKEEIRDMLKEAMVLSGYECLTAGNGREALECLAANPVDVVLTDIKMPEMNGLELTTHRTCQLLTIRTSDWRGSRRVPISPIA